MRRGERARAEEAPGYRRGSGEEGGGSEQAGQAPRAEPRPRRCGRCPASRPAGAEAAARGARGPLRGAPRPAPGGAEGCAAAQPGTRRLHHPLVSGFGTEQPRAAGLRPGHHCPRRGLRERQRALSVGQPPGEPHQRGRLAVAGLRRPQGRRPECDAGAQPRVCGRHAGCGQRDVLVAFGSAGAGRRCSGCGGPEAQRVSGPAQHRLQQRQAGGSGATAHGPKAPTRSAGLRGTGGGRRGRTCAGG
mmetsp:Transcript_9483/g.14604  ORF Transcript_9483/g.14604 Transcript_9483/m.14604 type:complete len:246 (+) Transcript_9483:833-1570(+)